MLENNPVKQMLFHFSQAVCTELSFHFWIVIFHFFDISFSLEITKLRTGRRGVAPPPAPVPHKGYLVVVLGRSLPMNLGRRPGMTWHAEGLSRGRRWPRRIGPYSV